MPAFLYKMHYDDNLIDVVFAADAESAALQVGLDPEDMKRVENFDKYEKDCGTHASCYAFHEEGYFVRCAYCDHLIGNNVCDTCESSWEDPEDDEKSQLETLGQAVDDGFYVYCDELCRSRLKEEVDRRINQKTDALNSFTQIHPKMVVTHTSMGKVPNCGCERGRYSEIIVYFLVPGGGLSEKTTQGNHFNNCYCHGCKRVFVARGDLDRFKELTTGNAR